MNDEPAEMTAELTADLSDLNDLDLSDLAKEPRGCLFALSQPPLMLFLAFVATLILVTAVHDLYRW
ncbi:hypothetical protein J7W19_05205 [Streptomyces mobaraensis NBRC 13819 = DSM 40847]|uniref:Uncharacterized protein n=2 Tax=Streptomyces mobaraensis TaxID=35621 RepID=A0A5N5VXU8_STRMB|nr:hypothetical protein [Streptomyces mobaraensis]EMF00808.1 hypothetical protein H340_09370 [Streptomyces mobaraensis NBRC 13819 = DSM 40847]KAB7833632.1 hypothetical protein FRZ00_33155 [Streptomyces mobaraensis]QTT78256.1 hypothetical protein J7W19_05205 [Streptomyces mobaraensis NBRC 13819 = DSM 40847]